ncbi:MAG TPA: ABC transporter substrate-binding protein [Pseudonocardiaceae bacterium]|jgi:ribose transport system substrate-binding protein|nr:ABC transporter substrate-binding protein [Pseudonocardiaceae bacterium]
MNSRRVGRIAAVSAIVALALVTTACTKAQSSGGGDSTNSSGAQQQVASSSGGPTCDYQSYGAPKLDLSKVTVGFSQSESTSNPFRSTETNSITQEASKEGIHLIQRNANADVNAQNSQIEEMIAQGAQVLIVAPENSDGLKPALDEAKQKHIPVLTIDRTATGTPCQDFIGFLGSDFYHQAQIAADDLAGATNNTANIAILLGSSGNDVTTDRTNGFTAEIKSKPGMKVIAQQTANFDETDGQNVMEQLLQSDPSINAVFAENDEMALGAIQAIKAAGKTPGTDIKIVSIDGTQQCVQDVASGAMVADVETNPRFGPLAFQALRNFYSTKGASTKITIVDHHYTKANASASLTNGSVY